MNSFDHKSIAFAIITYYPKWYRGKLRSIKHTDKVRGDLALEFFAKAAKLGYKVVVADGRSSKTFKKAVVKIHDIIFIKRRKLNPVDSKLHVIKKTAKIRDIKAIVLSEPEKVSLLNFIVQITKPVLEDKADIVIPERNRELFQKTYPAYMFESEREANKLYNEILRTNGILKEENDYDFFFGPRVFSTDKKVLKLFSRYYNFKIGKTVFQNSFQNFRVHSVPQFLPIVVALKKRMKISSVTVDFSYPQLQKENEEKGQKILFEEKRIYQRMSALLDLLYFLHSLQRT